jgi:hypothetical protein
LEGRILPSDHGVSKRPLLPKILGVLKGPLLPLIVGVLKRLLLPKLSNGISEGLLDGGWLAGGHLGRRLRWHLGWLAGGHHGRHVGRLL